MVFSVARRRASELVSQNLVQSNRTSTLSRSLSDYLSGRRFSSDICSASQAAAVTDLGAVQSRFMSTGQSSCRRGPSRMISTPESCTRGCDTRAARALVTSDLGAIGLRPTSPGAKWPEVRGFAINRERRRQVGRLLDGIPKPTGHRAHSKSSGKTGMSKN